MQGRGSGVGGRRKITSQNSRKITCRAGTPVHLISSFGIGIETVEIIAFE